MPLYSGEPMVFSPTKEHYDHRTRQTIEAVTSTSFWWSIFFLSSTAKTSVGRAYILEANIDINSLMSADFGHLSY